MSCAASITVILGKDPRQERFVIATISRITTLRDIYRSNKPTSKMCLHFPECSCSAECKTVKRGVW